MTMYNANNGKAMSKARMAILAGTLALSISPVVAIAETTGITTETTNTDTSSVETTNGTDTNRPPIADFGNRDDSNGFRMMGERPEMRTNAEGTMTEPPARPEGDQAPELPEGEQPQLTGERPELPTNADGTMAEPPTDGQAPTDADGNRLEPPAKPEGDQAPELPEGEQPQLTGERPELPTNADGTTMEPQNDGQAPMNADGTTGEAPTKPEGDKENDGEQDKPFFDRVGDFFRQMFDWISGTARK